jgi:hypothetical protein
MPRLRTRRKTHPWAVEWFGPFVIPGAFAGNHEGGHIPRDSVALGWRSTRLIKQPGSLASGSETREPAIEDRFGMAKTSSAVPMIAAVRLFTN